MKAVPSSSPLGLTSGRRLDGVGPRSAAFAGLSAAAIGVATLANPDTIEDGPVICPFRLATGLPCPGCGLTRSWVYAMHGQWADSIAANPFGVVALAAAMVFALVVAVALVRRRTPPDIGAVINSRAFWAVGAVWIGFGVVRLALALCDSSG